MSGVRELAESAPTKMCSKVHYEMTSTVPVLAASLRTKLTDLINEGQITPSTLSAAISPSALSRFLNGADEDSGLRICTFEKVLNAINAAALVI